MHYLKSNNLCNPWEYVADLALNPGFVSEINCELYKLLNPDAQNQVTDYHIRNLRLQGEELLSNEAVKAIADRY